MEVNGKIIQKVIINPKDVIEKLLEDELEFGNWVFEKNNLYYEGWDESAGQHSFERYKEIPKERYEYIKALQLVIKKLKN
jgi:hypothetical protein